MPAISCTSNFGYFDSPDFLKLSLHIVSTISTPVYCLGVYCILLKTPDQMKSVKWYLLILHLWITVFDYSVSLLIIPYLLYPEIAGIAYGLFSVIGVPTSVQVVFTTLVIAYMMISILSVYENRFFIRRFRFKEQWVQGRRIWLFLHYLTASICSQYFFLLIPDQESAKQQVFQNLPCLPDYVYIEPVFVLLDDFYIATILFVTVVFILALEFSFFILLLIKNATKQKKSMSKKTYKMHKQFFIALVIQLTPLLMLPSPFVYGYSTLIFKYHNQAAMNCVVIFFTTHGFVSTVVMILVHRPYRLAVKEMIRKDKRMMRKSTVVSVQLS